MCLLEHWQQAHTDMIMELVCIRPGYIWPAQVLQSEHQLPLCSDEGIAFCAGWCCTTTRIDRKQCVRAAFGVLGSAKIVLHIPAGCLRQAGAYPCPT